MAEMKYRKLFNSHHDNVILFPKYTYMSESMHCTITYSGNLINLHEFHLTGATINFYIRHSCHSSIHYARTHAQQSNKQA